MKVCTNCKQLRPLSEFWRDRSKKHGYSARCKPCKTAIFNRYRKERGYDKRRYWANRDSERERHLKRKYGITLADYAELLKRQGGCCAICRRSEPASKTLDVDHCHATGRVRGLLCTSCNRMIGHSFDNPETLARAATYLGIVPQVAARFIEAFNEVAASPAPAGAAGEQETA